MFTTVQYALSVAMHISISVLCFMAFFIMLYLYAFLALIVLLIMAFYQNPIVDIEPLNNGNTNGPDEAYVSFAVYDYEPLYDYDYDEEYQDLPDLEEVDDSDADDSDEYQATTDASDEEEEEDNDYDDEDNEDEDEDEDDEGDYEGDYEEEEEEDEDDEGDYDDYDEEEEEEKEEDEEEEDPEYEDGQSENIVLAGKVYKPVDVRVRPVPGVFPQEAMVHRRFPNNPLENLQPLSKCPPDFVPTERLTLERLESMKINSKGFLWPEEEKLFQHVMFMNQEALAFIDAERGTLKQSYFSDYIIPVIPHVPWSFKNIPIPPGIRNDVIKILKDRIAAGVYEPCQSSYRARWFCVPKKNGKLRIVHDLQPLNAVTIRDAGIPPNLDDFVEPFAGHQCYTVFDFFSGFDGRVVHINSRDLTAFHTPLGLLRITCLPQGFTNSPAEFQKCTTFILQDEIPHTANIFIDDLPIKGPKDQYLDEHGNPEVLKENPGIRRFIWEHANDVHRIMHRVKEAGCTFSATKSQICLPEVIIVGQKCTPGGRLPDDDKIDKVLKWPEPTNTTAIRGFTGLCGTMRIWIPNYSKIIRPLTELTRKGVEFIWTDRQQEAFDIMKQLITTAPVLRPIDYQSESPVILSVDTSQIAIGFILSQIDEQGRRHPARYGSLPINEREARYSQPKLELYGLYRALKHWKLYLIGVKNLHVEVDAQYIKGMLNQPDMQPGNTINRWIQGILLFDFKLVHVPATQFKGPDALSRREPAEDEKIEEHDDSWLDNIALHLSTLAPSIQQSKKDAILPIKPEFMRLITLGQKNHEYRKYHMKGVIRFWMYEIAPVSAITHLVVTTTPKIPGQVQDPTGIGNDDFDNGLKKSKFGYPVLKVYQLKKPITAKMLKRQYGIDPPLTGVYTPEELVKRELDKTFYHLPVGIQHQHTMILSGHKSAYSSKQNKSWLNDITLFSYIPNPQDIRDFCFTTKTNLPYKAKNLPSWSKAPSPADRTLQHIQEFLTTLEVPQQISLKDRRRFTKKVAQHFIKDGRMYKRNGDKSPTLVIFDPRKRIAILTQAHENLGHKGEHAVYTLVNLRFFWPYLRRDVHYHISSCHECQVRNLKRIEVSPTISTPTAIFEKVFIDVMYMPPSGGFHFIVAARDDLTGCTEACAIRKNNSHTLAKFFWEQIYCRYGAVGQVVTDNGPEVKGAFEILMRRMGIPQVRITPYNKHANGAVERGHFILREAIVKTSEKDKSGGAKNWHKHVEVAAFADRVTVSSVTGYSPYYLLHGTHPLLPFDISELTFMVEGFRSGMSESDLLSLRIRQLYRHKEDLDRAAEYLKKARFRSKQQFERRYRHRLQKDTYNPGDLVIVRNTRLEMTVTKFKTEPRYIGPYEVVKRTSKGNYILKELNGTEHAEQYAAFRLLPYVQRDDPILFDLVNDNQTEIDNSLSEQDGEASNKEDIYTNNDGNDTNSVQNNGDEATSDEWIEDDQ